MRRSVYVTLITAAVMTAAVATASAEKVYSSIPSGSLPGNVISQAFEATATVEFGDQIGFRGSARHATKVRVVVSSWGCQTGHWYSGDCHTSGRAGFNHPITLSLYNLGGDPTRPGDLLVQKTVTFAIPFRPSVDAVNCPADPEDGNGIFIPYKWYSRHDKTCYSGFAAKIEFDLNKLNVTLTDQVVWGVSFNTSDYGPAPLGHATPCYSSSAGCGYDSLNIGAETFVPDELVGIDADPKGAFINTGEAAFYCDGGASGVGEFRLDTGSPSFPDCWLGYRPLIEVEADKKK